MTTWYVVKGEKGAIQFMILQTKVTPRFYDFGVHSLQPQYDGHETMGRCKWLDNKLCYFSTSGMAGSAIYQSFLENEDPENLWKLLEEEYHAQFG